jgi:hypothetical protein
MVAWFIVAYKQAVEKIFGKLKRHDIPVEQKL